MPVTVGVTIGFCREEIKLFGPVHDHAVALLEWELKVTVLPIHIGLLFVAPVDVGAAITVTDVVYTVDGLQPLPVVLTVNE